MKKKMLFSLLAVGIMSFWGSAMAQTANYDPQIINDASFTGISIDHMLTSVEASGNDVVVTLTNVRLTPIGRNTEGRDLTTPSAIALFSGIMDAAGVKKAFVVAPVFNGTASFRIPNSGVVAGVTVVEHLWGRSADGTHALVHDPKDPFVVSDNGDLNTLAIGIVMYPSGNVKSLKPFGKLPQGKHPELKE